MTSRVGRLRQLLRRRRAPIGWGLAALAATGVAVRYAWPMALVEMGVREARACLVQYRSPREGPPPTCWGAMRFWVKGARYDWTFHDSTYHGEELKARIALADYLDAAIGSPEPEARAQAARRVAEIEEVVTKGSMRISMDALGDPIPSPRVGRWAEILGDGATLRERWEGLGAWQDRVAAAHAAIDAGDPQLLARMGKALGELESRDAGLREAAGAVLCLEAGGHARGLELLTGLERSRASDRYENFTRELGAVRVLTVGCADLAGVPAPALPELRAGGLEDRRSTLALLGLLATFRAERAGVPADVVGLERFTRARTDATVALDNRDGSVLERVALLATLAATTHVRAEEPAPDLVAYARRLFADRPLELAKSLSGWALETRQAPLLEGDVYEAGAAALLAVEASSPEADRRLLRYAAGALELEAARQHAFSGHDDHAAQAAERGHELVGAPVVARAVTRSTLALLTGDRAGALAELDLVAREELEQAQPAAILSWLVQRAELLAMLGSPEAAEVAVRADGLARQLVSRDDSAIAPALALAAHVARLGFAPGETKPSPGVVSTPVLLYPRIQTPWMGAGRHELRIAWEEPHVGAGPSPLASAEIRARVEVTLDALDAARAGTRGARRVLRYGLFDRRGDFPPYASFAAYLTSLLDPGDDAETWLDAALAIDRERLSHRADALLRAQAAWMRGDERAGERWFARFRRLCAYAGEEPRRGPMLQALRW